MQISLYMNIPISSYSFRGNYSFLNLEIQRSQYIRPKVTVLKGAETIQGRKLFKGGNYMRKFGIHLFYQDINIDSLVNHVTMTVSDVIPPLKPSILSLMKYLTLADKRNSIRGWKTQEIT